MTQPFIFPDRPRLPFAHAPGLFRLANWPRQPSRFRWPPRVTSPASTHGGSPAGHVDGVGSAGSRAHRADLDNVRTLPTNLADISLFIVAGRRDPVEIGDKTTSAPERIALHIASNAEYPSPRPATSRPKSC